MSVVGGGADAQAYGRLRLLLTQSRYWLSIGQSGRISLPNNSIAGGKVVPVIDRRYPLEATADALRHLGEGRTKGKVVITISHVGET